MFFHNSSQILVRKADDYRIVQKLLSGQNTSLWNSSWIKTREAQECEIVSFNHSSQIVVRKADDYGIVQTQCQKVELLLKSLLAKYKYQRW